MANLFTRIKDMIMADLNQVLDQKEKQNPIALLNHYLRQCEQETEKVKTLIDRQYILQDQFSKEYQSALELAAKRKHQAEVASQAGETALFEFAEEEHRQYAERAEHLSKAVEQTKTQLDELERKYAEMMRKLKDMKIRRMELMGRENVIRAQHYMNKILETDTISNKAVTRFHEIGNYLDRLEYQVNNSYFRSTIDSKIAELEKELKVKESKSI